MNDAKLVLSALEAIIEGSRRELPLIERCALRAGLDSLLQDVRDQYLAHFNEVDGYMEQKLQKMRWSINANLGFDITNGHDEQAHRVWAFSALGTVESLLRDKFPGIFPTVLAKANSPEDS